MSLFVYIRIITSPVTISLFPTAIYLDPIFEKDRDLDRFRFSYRAGQSVGPSVVLNTSGGPDATEYMPVHTLLGWAAALAH